MHLARWDDHVAGIDWMALASLDLPDSPAATEVTITFRSTITDRSSPAWLWLPGIQIQNSRGARYFMHPVADHLGALKATHPGDCHYELWDLQTDGPLSITYVSNGPRVP